MIVHRINPRESKYSANDKRDPTGLINYITGGEKESEDELEQLTSYVTDSKPSSIHKNEKVLLVDYNNIDNHTPEYASKEMYATALTCKSKTDIFYEHIVLSCPDFEKPSPKDLIEMAKDVVATLGADKNQAVYAVHDNTVNRHVHIALARTEIESCRTISNHLILDRLHYGTREVEIKFDTFKDEGIYETKRDRKGNYHIVKSDKHSRTNYTLFRDKNGELRAVLDSDYNKNMKSDSLSRGAELMEVQSGRESLQTYARKHLSGIRNAESWDEVHRIAGSVGLKVEASTNGRGILFSDAKSGGAKVKASNVDRKFSKPNLEKKLGEFVEAKEDLTVSATSTYDDKKFADRFKSKSVIESEHKAKEGLELSQNDKDNLVKVNRESRLYDNYLEQKESFLLQSKQRFDLSVQNENDKHERLLIEVEKEFDELVNKVRTKLDGEDLQLTLFKIDEDKKYTILEIKEDHLNKISDLREEHSTAPHSYPSYREWIEDEKLKSNNQSLTSEVSRSLSSGARRDIIAFKHTATEEQFSYEVVPLIKNQSQEVSDRIAQFHFEEIEETSAYVVAGFKGDTHVLSDKGEQIEVHAIDRSTIEAALLIGNEKSEKQGVYLSSSNDEFNQLVFEIAAEHNIKIHNSGGVVKDDTTNTTTTSSASGGTEMGTESSYVEETFDLDSSEIHEEKSLVPEEVIEPEVPKEYELEPEKIAEEKVQEIAHSVAVVQPVAIESKETTDTSVERPVSDPSLDRAIEKARAEIKPASENQSANIEKENDSNSVSEQPTQQIETSVEVVQQPQQPHSSLKKDDKSSSEKEKDKNDSSNNKGNDKENNQPSPFDKIRINQKILDDEKTRQEQENVKKGDER